MRLSTSFFVLPAAVLAACQQESGNYYCDETSKIQFNNVGFSGSYNRVTSFNDDKTCSSTKQSFSGSLSPLDEELSVHFRGPIQLENFAVYTKSGGSNQKREAIAPQLHHRHVEKRDPAVVYKAETATAIVTVNGAGNGDSAPTSAPAPAPAPVTTTSPEYDGAATTPAAASPDSAQPWQNTYVWTPGSESAAASSSSEPAAPATSEAPVTTTSQEFEPSSSSQAVVESSSSSSTSSSAAPATSSSSSGGSGSWSKTASYNADSSSASGLAFMNNLGGSGSGTFSFLWGNSLSYAGSDGTSAASSPQVLKKTTVPSNKEFIIFSDSECGENNGDCGYYRPGTVAHHGFGGDQKIFLFEFSMPTESQVSKYTMDYDMPAIWLLNAQIPRTLQYGNDECSCWKTGCGELDLFEVLTSGSDKMKATLHDSQGNNGGGPSDYFARPTSGTMTGAVIFDGENISIVKLDSFPSNVDDSTVQQWTSSVQSKISI